MAVNYHPDEIQFVLIDYKGGGLAGAFENKETGVKIRLKAEWDKGEVILNVKGFPNFIFSISYSIFTGLELLNI